jgi:hypothetical protein
MASWHQGTSSPPIVLFDITVLVAVDMCDVEGDGHLDDEGPAKVRRAIGPQLESKQPFQLEAYSLCKLDLVAVLDDELVVRRGRGREEEWDKGVGL